MYFAKNQKGSCIIIKIREKVQISVWKSEGNKIIFL